MTLTWKTFLSENILPITCWRLITKTVNGQMWRSNHTNLLAIEPSLAALHYGQSIFEGIKAYKNEQGEAFIFRPHDNYRRMNISAERINMPAIPEDIFMDGMRQLVELDKNWIPNKDNYSLYIRPLMFATDTALGVRPSETYKFIIILSPTGPYFTAPMKYCSRRKVHTRCPRWCWICKECR